VDGAVIATAGDALLADIIADPGDDGLRLIYADWLEESGDEARAEFIRVQIKIVRGGFCKFSRADTCFDRRDNATEVCMTGCAACAGLARRQASLLGENVSDEPNTVEPRYYRWLAGTHSGWVRVPGYTDTDDNSFRRGFVSEVFLPLAAALEHLPKLVRSHPLTRVELTDRGPLVADAPGGKKASWRKPYPKGGPAPQLAGAFTLPEEVWLLLPGRTAHHTPGWKTYKSVERAVDVASDAWLAWARLPANR
jgi:uncharacterized protein (TIGR02996 family)